MPTYLRVRLTHAAVQVMAEDAGVRVLHVKGPALDERLLQRAASDGSALPRHSTDADIIVEPRGASRLIDEMGRHGFEVVTSFSTGSAFEHAASLWSDTLGWADVHRTFPGLGVDPAVAFEALWRDRSSASLAGWDCPVPSLTAQRLLLLLHAARTGGEGNSDVVPAWRNATDEDRDAVRDLAVELHADIGLAAATGTLDDFQSHPEYELWLLFSGRSHGRLAEWRARVKAAPTRTARLRLVVRSMMVNTDAMSMQLHRRPTRTEIVREFGHRFTVVGRELVRIVLRRKDERA